jgi:hypothetical protein
VTVLMSTDTWEDYRVPAAPYFVLVDGTGRIAGEGSARSWSQVASLIGTASGDAEAARGPREERVDDELAAAGILPGDPRLYHPSIASADSTWRLEGRLGDPTQRLGGD